MTNDTLKNYFSDTHLEMIRQQMQQDIDRMFYSALGTTCVEPEPQPTSFTEENLKALTAELTMFSTPVFIPNTHMTKTVEDWSGVRSPSRAARRRRQGHRQNIVFREVPDETVYVIGKNKYVGHPEILARITT
jgi:hypothetical protein